MAQETSASCWETVVILWLMSSPARTLHFQVDLTTPERGRQGHKTEAVPTEKSEG